MVQFSTTIHLHLAGLYATKHFWKKLVTGRGMFIEQIFELRGPGPPRRIGIPITGCFHDKTVISEENIRLDCYLVLKYCRRQCTLLPPTWAKSRTKSNSKVQDFKYVFGLNCKQTENWTTLKFNWFSNVENLVLLNGSEYVRNVIEWY